MTGQSSCNNELLLPFSFGGLERESRKLKFFFLRFRGQVTFGAPLFAFTLIRNIHVTHLP